MMPALLEPRTAHEKHRYILGMRVDATSYADAAERVVAWAHAGESRYVCAANSHMVMEAHDSPSFRRVVNAADLVTPDGMPLVWMLRRLGAPHPQRVCGPMLVLKLCEAAQHQGVPVGFYGGSEECIERLVQFMHTKFPELKIAYAYSPPFRLLTESENDEVASEINASGARILFVGLGCPKQEYWMSHRRGQVSSVMVGVGAAFLFHAGLAKRAPDWMQAIGAEWLFRLGTEPRRLWARYLKHNPRFAVLAAMQALGRRFSPEVE